MWLSIWTAATIPPPHIPSSLPLPASPLPVCYAFLPAYVSLATKAAVAAEEESSGRTPEHNEALQQQKRCSLSVSFPACSALQSGRPACMIATAAPQLPPAETNRKQGPFTCLWAPVPFFYYLQAYQA